MEEEEEEGGGGVNYYCFVPRSLGSRWVGFGELIAAAVCWLFHGQEGMGELSRSPLLC